MTRFVKPFGLAAVLALMAVAIAGAAPASATKVCSANKTGTAAACTSGFEYGTNILSTDTLTGGLVTESVLIAPGLPEIVCNSASVAGKAPSSAAGAISGEITSLAFSECEAAGFECEVTTHAPYPAKASNTANQAGSNGTMEVTIANEAAKRIHIVCGGVVNCEVHGTAKGSLYNPGNANAPGGAHAFATVNFNAGSGSTLSGCGVGNDTYISGYEINAANGAAGALHIE